MIYEPPPDVNSDMQKQGQLSTPEQLSSWAAEHRTDFMCRIRVLCVSLSSSAGQGG